MIGPSRSAAGVGGTRSLRVRRCMSQGFFLPLLLHTRGCGLRAEALFNPLPPFPKLAPSLDVRPRIARERVPPSQRHRQVRSSCGFRHCELSEGPVCERSLSAGTIWPFPCIPSSNFWPTSAGVCSVTLHAAKQRRTSNDKQLVRT